MTIESQLIEDFKKLEEKIANYDSTKAPTNLEELAMGVILQQLSFAQYLDDNPEIMKE